MSMFYSDDNTDVFEYTKQSQSSIQFGCFKIFTEIMGWQTFYNELVLFIKSQDLALNFKAIDKWASDNFENKDNDFKIKVHVILHNIRSQMQSNDVSSISTEPLTPEGIKQSSDSDNLEADEAPLDLPFKATSLEFKEIDF